MAGESVEIIGLPELQSTLHRAAVGIANMDRAGRAAAQLVTASGRSQAPRRTGRLAASIHASESKQGSTSIGSNLVYAPVIHWGWPGHNISANPFLSRALDQNADRILDLYTRDAATALGKVKGA